MSAMGHKRKWCHVRVMSVIPLIVLQNSPTARVSSLWGECQSWCFACSAAISGDRRQIYDIRRELGLRSAGDWHDRWWSFEILSEFSQVQTSSRAPLKPLSRSRSSFRMRFMWANSISTFLRSRRDCWKASVLASARTRSRTSSSMSRVTLRTGPIVHWGLSGQAEQSLLRAR
jgi:hypothetical protein